MTSNLLYQQDLILEDTTVLLRPLQVSDYAYLLGFSLNEPEIWKHSLVRADSADNLANYLQIAMKGKLHQTEFPFIVFDKRTKQYAGSTRYYDINMEFKTLQIGYTWYGKNFQGTRLNKHCKYLLLCYAFEVLQMERVEFRADNSNERSKAAMLSIGCTIEGVLRSNMPTFGSEVRRDTVVFSILKNEWFGTIKNKLKSKIEY